MSDFKDIAGMREQIIANVVIAFPLISPSGRSPVADSDGNKYRIITRSNYESGWADPQSWTQAVVVYGAHNSVFVCGRQTRGTVAAMASLLSTTEDLIQDFYKTSKLPLLEADQKKKTKCGGSYDPAVGASLRTPDAEEDASKSWEVL